MKTRHFVVMAIFMLLASSAAFADRQLDRAEILQIFEQLTSQPRETWIPAGTMEARREEYRAPKITDLNELKSRIRQEVVGYQRRSDKRELTKNLQKMKLDAVPFNIRYELSNGYTMNSSVIVKFDGDRYYWEVNVDSRTDSVKPGKDLEDNFMTDQFNLEWNAKRIFAWDGENYTTYSLPANCAMVDSTGSTPHAVGGPLTAGIVPWGYGFYTYENLEAADSSAVEKYVDGQLQVHLTLDNPDGSQMLFVMDPQKNYALMAFSIVKADNSFTLKLYSGHQLVSDSWIPTTILLERYEAGSNRLLARDLWEVTNINADVPESYEFDVSYEADALIEYFSSVTDRSVMYRHSDIINTEQLLADRLAYAAVEGTQPQNCATISLKHAASLLGKDVTDQQLAQLVAEPNNTTSLYAMKQFAENLGLNCRAVKIDIETLKNLTGCEVILHIPGKNHFVVLEAIDDKYVWVTDLSGDKFYYRKDINFFVMDWAEGTALIMSNGAIEGEFAEIDESELGNIIGASGYACKVPRQTFGLIRCEYVGGLCGGYYRLFFPRWGCGEDESGSCYEENLPRYKKKPCVEDPPNDCVVSGEPWTYYYMRACY